MYQIILAVFFIPVFLSAQLSDIDGKTYSSLKIGNAVWMAENLSVTKFRNGDPIPLAVSSEDWVEHWLNEKPAYCHIDNNPAKGILYNWYAVSDSRNLAPDGWRVANDADWAALAKHYGGWKSAGKRMRYAPKGKKKKTATNLFNAFEPTRMRYMSGAFEESSDKSYWWSSTPKESAAGYRWISQTENGLNSDMCNKKTGYSIRCVKE